MSTDHDEKTEREALAAEIEEMRRASEAVQKMGRAGRLWLRMWMHDTYGDD